MKYNYIIAGGGCAGLSMAWHLLYHGPKKKKILLIDPDLSLSNTKTWCYWTKEDMAFSRLNYKTWERMNVGVKDEFLTDTLIQYPYQCIREIDYKKFILDEIRRSDLIDLLEARVTEIYTSDQPRVLSDKGSYEADYIFQSCFTGKEKEEKSTVKLKQHFRGWEIKTHRNCFDPETITLMDFNTSQHKGVTFFYTLPFKKRHAIIEYTLFTAELLEKEVYEQALKIYTKEKLNLKDDEFEVVRTENGCIPMGEQPPVPDFGEKVVSLGTAGGVTKPATGYTFTRIQKQCRQIAENLARTGKPEFDLPSSYRFRLYDNLLLKIIRDHPNDAVEVFYRLFRDNDFDALLKFLDEKTRFSEELKIFSTVPYFPFFRAISRTNYLS